jgi:hypothetical protein
MAVKWRPTRESELNSHMEDFMEFPLKTPLNNLLRVAHIFIEGRRKN